MKRNLTVFLSLILCTGHAQQGPVGTSGLTRIPLTRGAVRVTDAAATREFGQFLNGLARDQGSGCQVSEYLVWDDPELAGQIGGDLATQLKARGLTFKELSEEEDEESYALSFLLTDKDHRYVGLLYGDTGSVVLGWCQLKTEAQAGAAPAKTTQQPPVSTPSASTPPARYKVGDRVMAKFTRLEYENEATIQAIEGGRYRVHSEDSTAEDAWVLADRLSPYDPGDTAAGPPAGTYLCYHPMYENAYMGSFVIPSPGRYTYLTGNKRSGEYTYVAAQRTILWKGGELSTRPVTGEYVNTANNGPIILLLFADGKGRRAGDYQRCLLKN